MKEEGKTKFEIKTLNLYSKTEMMDLQTDIQWIISELSKVRDPELINAFKSMLKYRQKHQTSTDWWDEVSEEERSEIQEGLNQLDRGEVVSHEEVMKSYDRWLSK